MLIHHIFIELLLYTGDVREQKGMRQGSSLRACVSGKRATTHRCQGVLRAVLVGVHEGLRVDQALQRHFPQGDSGQRRTRVTGS